MAAPAGIRTDARGPTALIRCPLTTMTASLTGAPPLPSISVPPTMAMSWAIAGRYDIASSATARAMWDRRFRLSTG